ncbi:MAG: epoxyqueuosine reductase QueH [Lachnospiraceae bacterium]|nr:epoxyqueuosine reductase QueH [Lachnospiraceae bacterium]
MNKRNYQRELDAVIEGNLREGIRPKLLLHVCCAPCSSYVQEYLTKYFDITLFFYNPNMDSKEEYDRRASELERLVREAGFPSGTVICDYDPESFEDMVKGLENEPEGGARCLKCYELRMRKAAGYAAEKGFDYFTTTLSISPYKNAEWINETGERLAEEYGVAHLPSDFKKKNGYKRSIELSREYELYRQDYCGCAMSEKERHGGSDPQDKGQYKTP